MATMKNPEAKPSEQANGDESSVQVTGKVITMKLPKFSKEALRRIRRVRAWERRSTEGVLGVVVGRPPGIDRDEDA